MNILTALLGLSLGLSVLLASLRRKRAEAETGRARASELHRLREAMAAAGGTEAMPRAAAQAIANLVDDAARLTPREMAPLEALAKAPGKVLSHRQLLSEVRGAERGWRWCRRASRTG